MKILRERNHVLFVKLVFMSAKKIHSCQLIIFCSANDFKQLAGYVREIYGLPKPSLLTIL